MLNGPLLKRRLIRLAVVGCAGALLAGCASPAAVDLAPTTPGPSAAAACAASAAALPHTVRDLPRREVQPSSPTTAAWGDPPITLTCGVPRPTQLQADTTLLSVDGVDWFAQQLTRGTRFTATGRVAYLRVDVPEDYTSATDALTDLADAVRKVPLADPGS